MSAAEMKIAFDDFYEPLDLPKVRVRRVEDLEMAGPGGPIKLRLYYPSLTDSPAPICMYYHGGGLAFGSLRSFDSICRWLCAASGAIIAFVDYRMTPEHKFPAAVEDALAAAVGCFRNARALGADPDRFAVAGDSAGGNLAAVICQLARGERAPHIRSQVLIYPVVGSRQPTESSRLYSTGHFFEPDGMQWLYDNYLRSPLDYSDIRVSPGLADDLSGLPQAFILTAGYDALRDEAEAYGQRMAAAGVDVTVHRYSSNLHGFLNMGGVIDEVGPALDDCARHLKKVFSNRERVR
jgi:acetyl esterase